MVEKFLIPIHAFQQDRMIRVYLPESYTQSEERYPVLYMHDGQNVFHDEEAIDGVSLGLEDYLNQSGDQVIVVGIDNNPGEERVNEYCPWVCGEFSQKILGKASPLGGKGEAYADFLVRELKPLIDRKYRTRADQTYLAGISLGALISTYIVCRYPGVFQRMAGLSSGFYRNQEEIERLLQQTDLAHMERFYLDCGTDEAGDEKEISPIFVASNQSIYDIVQKKIVNTKFEIIDQGRHHYRDFKDRFPGILTYLLGS